MASLTMNVNWGRKWVYLFWPVVCFVTLELPSVLAAVVECFEDSALGWRYIMYWSQHWITWNLLPAVDTRVMAHKWSSVVMANYCYINGLANCVIVTAYIASPWQVVISQWFMSSVLFKPDWEWRNSWFLKTNEFF